MPGRLRRVGSASKSTDRIGFPAVSVTIDERDAPQFEEFTGGHVHRSLAIIVDGNVVSVADIAERLPGQFQIYGRFTDAQCDQMLRALQ